MSLKNKENIDIESDYSDSISSYNLIENEKVKQIENHESKPSISETVVNTFRNTDAF